MLRSEVKKNYKNILSGLYFGMIIQLAVGPVCLYVFQSGNKRGFEYAEVIVLAVVLVDALYIIFALSGISFILRDERTKLFLKLFGSFILFTYGVNILLSEFMASKIIPAVNIFENFISDNPFCNGIIITASNPLTILFWSGVFSAKISNDQLSKSHAFYFSMGCIIASLLFLTAIAYISSFVKSFLPATVIKYLNMTVGLVLIYFAVKMITKKRGK